MINTLSKENEQQLNVQSQRENLFKLFSFVKKNTDHILEEDTNAFFSKNPLVDIETIAKNLGLTEIQKVAPKDVDYKHARLKGKIILVNKEDTPGEQRFSIAHEIFHFLFTEKEAARSMSNPELEIWKIHKENTFEYPNKLIATATSKELGKFISGLIGKAVSEKTEKIVFEKIGKNVLEIMTKYIAEPKEFISNETALSIYQEISNAIYEVISEIITEEVADYFAANLIVPTERFILWKDKSNKEIADAFRVTEDCIRKRREEIDNELYFMVPKDLSSDIKIEETALLSYDELDHILEGYGVNATGRG
ncbi:ImmA/IrrE family metallo-endopeptidase [Treponema sp. R80B11-R83G3]